jgi:hypothetical protein
MAINQVIYGGCSFIRDVNINTEPTLRRSRESPADAIKSIQRKYPQQISILLLQTG